MIRNVAMISQPMGDRSEEDILAQRNKAMKVLDDMGYEVVDSYIYDADEDLRMYGYIHLPVYYLGKSLEFLAKADVLYVCDGWENARGCRIEVETAKAYNIPIIYETRPKLY